MKTGIPSLPILYPKYYSMKVQYTQVRKYLKDRLIDLAIRHFLLLTFFHTEDKY